MIIVIFDLHVFLFVQYIAEFGTNHVYNADTFNENQPKSR